MFFWFFLTFFLTSVDFSDICKSCDPCARYPHLLKEFFLSPKIGNPFFPSFFFNDDDDYIRRYATKRRLKWGGRRRGRALLFSVLLFFFHCFSDFFFYYNYFFNYSQWETLLRPNTSRRKKLKSK